MNRLAAADRSATAPNTHLSRSVSFSLLDRDGNELAIETDSSHPIEILIPRDQNLPVPPMILQNVTSLSLRPHAQTFNLHFVNLSTFTSSFSIHLQMRPLNSHLSYMLIYAFDRSPRLNSSINDIDGYSLFCPSLLRTYFLDNKQTMAHQSITFGIRQLNATEAEDLCMNRVMLSPSSPPPRGDQAFHFTDDYELRLFTSGCFYLDADHRWRSDGLQVGPLTNLSHTQCFSTHLTTFASGFLVLHEPINWNFIFAIADITTSKPAYVTIICAAVVYLLAMMYILLKDKKAMIHDKRKWIFALSLAR